MTRLYAYVGPARIREEAAGQPPGAPVADPGALAAWLAGAEEGWATFTVGRDGLLRLAPLRSEHVACAGGQPVLSAGMIGFVREGSGWAVCDVTNQSTGYCPEPASWPAVAAALDRVPLARPGGWTHAFEFRRCPACGQINLVKDGWLACDACGAELPAAWNFA